MAEKRRRLFYSELLHEYHVLKRQVGSKTNKKLVERNASLKREVNDLKAQIKAYEPLINKNQVLKQQYDHAQRCIGILLLVNDRLHGKRKNDRTYDGTRT